MQLYAREMLASWVEQFPEDQLLVLGYEWTRELALPRVEVRVFQDRFFSRISGQWLWAGFEARRYRADALLSVSSVVSPLFASGRRFCVVHDYRHLIRPEEFGAFQRLYRRGWNWSIAHAATAFQISHKTAAETRRFVPNANVLVVENGRDHARRWDLAPLTDERRDYIVTFGHFINKRASLVVEAMAQLKARYPTLELVVLGARGREAERIARLAADVGVGPRVRVPGYVQDNEYQQLVAQAKSIILASSDEGFGLPVCEANYLGVPCVVASDSGLLEIHGNRVVVAEPTAQSMARAIEASFAAPRTQYRSEAESWAAAARRVREELARVADIPIASGSDSRDSNWTSGVGRSSIAPSP